MEDFRRVIKSVDENTQANSRARLAGNVDADVFIKDPTSVLKEHITGHDLCKSVAQVFWFGRLAMALEIVTVQRLLETLQLESEHEQTISVLQTLLQDQGIAEQATQWYELLCEWRRIKLVRADDVRPPRGTSE